MNQFVNTINTTRNETRTENGMKTFDKSASPHVDLFFKIGATRNGQDVRPIFEKAFQEDALLAQKILLWARDVRGGAGERAVVRDLLQFMELYHKDELAKLLPAIPEVGRWDDLLVFQSETFCNQAFALIEAALQAGNGLCAKWMPRKGLDAVALRRFMKLTPKNYRKTIVGLSNTVEQKMCAQEWTDIEFGKLPSVASARYQKAFGRHAPIQYGAFKAALEKGEATINASTLYPYDVIRSVRYGDQSVALAQWEALPNYMNGNKVLALVDVSGSMLRSIGGAVTAMDAALSLGLYVADKNTGPFKDTFLTFSGTPELLHLKGNLLQKLQQMSSSSWAMNTDLNKAFAKILSHAQKNDVSAEDMPNYLLILSDMEFDACVQHDDSAIEMIRRKYEESGYTMPNVIFWNLASRSSNVPVKFNETGTGLISGFSPNIMTAVLGGEVDPYKIMLRAVDTPRYNKLLGQ